MITWKFDELDIYFKSKAENLTRDISKMAYANGVKQNAKITIIDGPTTQLISPDADSSNGDTDTIPQPTVPVDTKKTKTRKPKADELSALFSNVDYDSIMSNGVELPADNSDSSGSSDGIFN